MKKYRLTDRQINVHVYTYVTSFGICHKCTCRLLQGPTSFDRMHSVLG